MVNDHSQLSETSGAHMEMPVHCAPLGGKTMTKKISLGLVLAVLLGVVAIQAQAPAPSAIKRNVMIDRKSVV